MRANTVFEAEKSVVTFSVVSVCLSPDGFSISLKVRKQKPLFKVLSYLIWVVSSINR